MAVLKLRPTFSLTLIISCSNTMQEAYEVILSVLGYLTHDVQESFSFHIWYIT